MFPKFRKQFRFEFFCKFSIRKVSAQSFCCLFLHNDFRREKAFVIKSLSFHSGFLIKFRQHILLWETLAISELCRRKLAALSFPFLLLGLISVVNFQYCNLSSRSFKISSRHAKDSDKVFQNFS